MSTTSLHLFAATAFGGNKSVFAAIDSEIDHILVACPGSVLS